MVKLSSGVEDFFSYVFSLTKQNIIQASSFSLLSSHIFLFFWILSLNSAAGVTPFIVAGIEFSKRIVSIL